MDAEKKEVFAQEVFLKSSQRLPLGRSFWSFTSLLGKIPSEGFRGTWV